MASWEQLTAVAEGALGVAVVGEGVDLTTQAAAFEAGFQEAGQPVSIITIDVPKEEFEPCMRHLLAIRYQGVAVANPYKVDAARIAERFWVARFSLGVANTLCFDNGIFAQNTEVPAIAQCVADLSPTRALVMGSGHAARSVVAALLDKGWSVRLWNRNRNKTKVLYTLLSRYGDVEICSAPDPAGCRLIVNATPLGAKPGEQPPMDWARVLPRTACMDLVFRRVPTEFLRTAATRGLKTVDGREILVEQCALAMEWWLDRPVPRTAMRTALGLKSALPT